MRDEMLPNRILIANRGEIAVRVIAACHELGIEAVALYTSADAAAMHVRRADRAVMIDGVSVADSYLRIDKILRAAKLSGATAIHPGYGFLSENADFADACGAEGITFIGPPGSAMRQLGNKIAAKALAEKVGVPTVPGYRGTDRSPSTLAGMANQIGYPILIKAAAGGGGRGMRVVHRPNELAAAAEAAAREALAAFGDDTIFIERYIDQPRHIEVQILADNQGTVLAIGERECSIQRRHQKVIEEAPSPDLDAGLRKALCEAAIKLARAAAYTNAGTVEFLLGASDTFYFLEMNTRLQVEHPVTELVSGIDLVVAQIRIAAGEPLPMIWHMLDPIGHGHAIEARLYAEDPGHGFVPATGKLLRCDLPHLPGIRIDSGVESGDVVSVHYDPLLAKVIAHGETRDAARSRLLQALRQCEVLGLTTNLAYLKAILSHPDFVTGTVTTTFLERHEQELVRSPDPAHDLEWYAAALALTRIYESDSPAAHAPRALSWGRQLGPWRHRAQGYRMRLRRGEQERTISLVPRGERAWLAHMDGREQPIAAEWHDAALTVSQDTGMARVRAAVSGDMAFVDHEGSELTFMLAPPPQADSKQGSHDGAGLLAPMPGVIVRVHVQEGQTVDKGQPLLVLEAMKMEHVIMAPNPGVVRKLPFAQGTLVPAGATLAEIEERVP